MITIHFIGGPESGAFWVQSSTTFFRRLFPARSSTLFVRRCLKRETFLNFSVRLSTKLHENGQNWHDLILYRKMWCFLYICRNLMFFQFRAGSSQIVNFFVSKVSCFSMFVNILDWKLPWNGSNDSCLRRKLPRFDSCEMQSCPIEHMGASSLKQQGHVFRNRSSIRLARNHSIHMWNFMIFILKHSKLHDFRRTLDALKRRLHEKGAKNPNANQQTSPKRYPIEVLGPWDLCLV